MFLFARGDNREINKWLEENPLVLGGGAILIGVVLLLIGINAIKTQQATTKRGGQLEGGQAVAMGWIWTAFGGLCLLFGLYKCLV
jgi:uncharacterized membrane protein